MRLGKKELGVIAQALTCYLDDYGLSKGDAAYVAKLRTKVLDSVERKAAPLVASGAPGVSVGPIHDALVAAAGGKVAPMATASPAWRARASRRLASVGATVESAARLGKWIHEQTWLTSVLGWDTVLHKWEDWHARASAAPDSAAGPAAGRRKASW